MEKDPHECDTPDFSIRACACGCGNYACLTVGQMSRAGGHDKFYIVGHSSGRWDVTGVEYKLVVGPYKLAADKPSMVPLADLMDTSDVGKGA